MGRFRAVSHVEVAGRRVRASATVVVSVAVEAAEPEPPRRRPAAAGWVPTGLRDPDVRWDVLPPRILPEEWSTGQAGADVPPSLIAAEVERRPEGFGPAG